MENRLFFFPDLRGGASPLRGHKNFNTAQVSILYEGDSKELATNFREFSFQIGSQSLNHLNL